MAKITKLNAEQITNDAAEIISYSSPYRFQVTIEGSAPLLFHRWSVDSIEAKSVAAKGSKAKKTDDLESYVYRTEKGNLAIPGEYLRGALIAAAKFKQDPRSPRKSAMDLTKAAIVALTTTADLGQKNWDYLDKRRVVIQRSGITRTRPAMNAGWTASFEFLVTLPEYIGPSFAQELLSSAGRLIGVGDFRPTFGRFNVTNFKTLKE